ncbi:uncharacterized protein LOC123523025 [Mercenaria mercenaria]|uniref:uncharacterized protein LOC123523025 n=1 Tax=Mercenaria mercenaria TaxID=6596 RepID=UPI00234EDB7D|nr:uncharacterized protein LOC123523025 [Mercenaria mercenaria]
MSMGSDEKISLKLVEVLKEIGLSEQTVLKMRNTYILSETLDNIPSKILNTGEKTYMFGSNTEGTTTCGLESDVDTLLCIKFYNVMQHTSEFKLNMLQNLMMINSEASPGYCFLQIAGYDDSVILSNPINTYKDKAGRTLLKNTMNNYAAGMVGLKGMDVHGPSLASNAYLGYRAEDTVTAFPCTSWPKVAQSWLSAPSKGQWPSGELKKVCANKKCFVVPVASRGSKYRDLEWRISFSLAERYLMFSLNITQIRCYVLMKMILKSYLNLEGDFLSSYMCKTVLFHCVENEDPNIWQEQNQIKCLNYCCKKLKEFVRDRNCPHFILRENNLMLHRFSTNDGTKILSKLENILSNTCEILLSIKIDDLGNRLKQKLNKVYRPINGQYPSAAMESECRLLIEIASTVSDAHKMLLSHATPNTMFKTLFALLGYCKHSNCFKKTAGYYLASLFCTSTAMTIASSHICLEKQVSREALFWIKAGLNSDVASSRLKLASALYSSGHAQEVNKVLDDTANLYAKGFFKVQPMCNCDSYPYLCRSIEFDVCEIQIQNVIAFCVRFLPYEINCIPKELRYEMFRTTKGDQPYRRVDGYWMDWAAVDSYPFLYFLYYKTFGCLQLREYQLQTLNYLHLQATEMYTLNLAHRETALNLVGQLMEQENRVTTAFQCYLQSLKIRDRNNAAKWHICRLLAELIAGY